MRLRVLAKAVLGGAAALGLWSAAHAAPTPVAPQPPEYTQPIIDGAAQFAAIGYTKEVPNPFQPLYTYTPIAAPDGDATVDWYDITMRQIVHTNAGLVDDRTAGTPLLPGFKVWAYGATAGASTYPGMTLVGTKGKPVKVVWRNQLPVPHILPVDRTMMCGPPGFQLTCPDNRVVAHAHGAHTYDHSDGIPEMWFTPPPAGAGPEAYPEFFGSQWQPNDTFGVGGATVSPYTYLYPMDQEAATIWYHDHATGVTRLNAYAGLAGFFLITDQNEAALRASNVLPAYPYETGLAFQDKTFWATPTAGAPAYAQLGQMAFPDEAAGLPPIQPSIVPEMFGNIWLINGVAWPKMTVEPRKYRVRLLNGCDSRAMVVQLTRTAAPAPGKGGSITGAPVPFLVIGNDQGFLDKPARVTSLTVMPGQRYDVVVDFSNLALGTKVYMMNLGPEAPFDGTLPPVNPIDPLYPVADPASTAQLMLFQVVTPLDPAVPNATVTVNSVLRQPGNGTPALPVTPAPGTAAPTRSVYLKEVTDANGRLELMLGTKNGSPMGLFDTPTELPPLGATEIWEVANLTPDAHPIHLHLVKFRIFDREPITRMNNGTTTLLGPYPGAVLILPKATPQVWTYAGGGVATALPPDPNEVGWLDTFVSVPGTLTRLEAKFDIPGLYVWHCHILSHEEFDMMRHYGVTTPPSSVFLRASSTSQVVSAAPKPVTFFASGQTGIPTYASSQNFEFKFWLKDPVTGWAVKQNWSLGSNWTWRPPANASGVYYVQVDMRTPGTVARERSKVMAYVFGGPTPTALTLTPLNGSQLAAASQTPVTFSAAGTTNGVPGTYEYRFWLKDPVTGWSVQRAYSTVPTWTWTPPANTGACYFVQVDCRAAGSLAKADRSVVTRYTVQPRAVDVGSNKPSPQPAATVGTVVFIATPIPAAGTYEYQFWVRSSTGTWGAPVQPYGPSNTFTWNPPTVPGLYYVQVDVRCKNSLDKRAVYKVISYQLN